MYFGQDKEVEMRNPLKDLLTGDEQKVLLGFCFILGLGMVLTFLGWTPMQAKTNKTKQQVVEATRKDIKLNLDIRTATAEELTQLPGIGIKRANDIVAYRASSPFGSHYDLIKVKGVGSKTMQAILPHLLPFGADSLGTKSLVEAPKSKTKAENNSLVFLNCASLEELCSLSGIGAVKAQAIIDYRKENGDFQSIEDIIKVKGIGPKTLEKNRARLRL